MKTIKKIALLLTLFVIGTSYVSSEETKYLGLGYEPGQGTGWRKAQIINDFIYVPTDNGIFRKSVQTLNDTIWEHFGFIGIPVRDFVKHNDSIIAVTSKSNDSILLLSTDNGKTYINYTSDFFVVPGKSSSVNQIVINPLNSKSILVTGLWAGGAKSTDFGKSWSGFEVYALDYFGLNPNDTTNIFYAGVTGFYEPIVVSSYDNGKTWNETILRPPEPQDCNVLCFHPSNPNIILAGLDARIDKSTDKGLTWSTTISNFRVSNSSIVYDIGNSDIIYTTGISFEGKSIIYRSINGGESWELFYSEVSEQTSSTYDMHKHKNNLLLFTSDGVFRLDLNTVGTKNIRKDKMEVSIFHNVSNASLQCKSSELLDYFRLVDITGRLLTEYKPESVEFSLDVRNYSKGIYIAIFGNKNNLLKRKIMIKY